MTIQVIDALLQMGDSEMAQLLSADEQFNVSTSIYSSTPTNCWAYWLTNRTNEQSH